MVVFLYFFVIVLANLLVATFGPWFSIINAFFLIGLDLVLRDHLHDSWQGKGFLPRMLGLIIGAGIVSYILNPASGQIAIASAIAFSVAGLVNMMVYHFLIKKEFLYRVNLSNIPASLTDSILFPTIAFGVFMPEIVAAQFAAKFLGGFIWSFVIMMIFKKNKIA